MAEQDSGGSGGGKMGSLMYMLFAIVVLSLGITVMQVYLNAPEARAQVACYNVSVIHSLFWVTPINIFAPTDYAWQLSNAQDVHLLYERCISTLEETGYLHLF